MFDDCGYVERGGVQRGKIRYNRRRQKQSQLRPSQNDSIDILLLPKTPDDRDHSVSRLVTKVAVE
jgi:hypothetical protein